MADRRVELYARVSSPSNAKSKRSPARPQVRLPSSAGRGVRPSRHRGALSPRPHLLLPLLLQSQDRVRRERWCLPAAAAVAAIPDREGCENVAPAGLRFPVADLHRRVGGRHLSGGRPGEGEQLPAHDRGGQGRRHQGAAGDHPPSALLESLRRGPDYADVPRPGNSVGRIDLGIIRAPRGRRAASRRVGTNLAWLTMAVSARGPVP